ncbi:MAG: TIGR04086 family membrane protein [Defluviitaleaceae bacterium]|nr:TIGR04086 family membrane protein [Defluviitaleaceae bacterium]
MKKIFEKIRREQVIGVIMGVVIAYAITAISFIGAAIAITYTNLQETALPAIVMISVVLSVLVAGFDSARKADNKGWLWGMVAGLLYAIVFIGIIVWVADGFIPDMRQLTLLALSLVGGGVGGAIGINFKK